MTSLATSRHEEKQNFVNAVFSPARELVHQPAIQNKDTWIRSCLRVVNSSNATKKQKPSRPMFFYSMIFQLKQEMRTLCNKANTLQSRAVVKTI